ncbi:DUF3289 family protein [Lonsdalea quercina]|uniref:DUF3289 family protein n=1 Tax=Lonsdalea quercina TaxID=71657 RepID=UPI0039753D78
MVIPALIYSTKHKMDDYEANDMKYGDLDIDTLRNRFNIDVYYLGPYSEKDLSLEERAIGMFDEFRKKSGYFSWRGDYKNVILEMINHMQENTGTPFSSPLLDDALKNQKMEDNSGTSSLLRIKETLSDVIDFEKGFIPLENKDLFSTGINKHCVLPKFNEMGDCSNGLVISAHDTWATHITLESLEIQGDAYRAKVYYHAQDHFGLDDNDILDPIYRRLEIFNLWFTLQRWQKFGYKPFITEMNATIEINGGRSE